MRFAHLKSTSVVDMVDKFRHAEVPQSLSRIQLLLFIEVLQLLVVSVEVHLNTY